MEFKPGTRLRSAVCETEVIVVKAPPDPVTLRCGGREMLPVGAEQPAGVGPEAGHDGGTLLGKRYADPECGLEVLCTKPGRGSLAVDGRTLQVAEAKPLPSSD